MNFNWYQFSLFYSAVFAQASTDPNPINIILTAGIAGAVLVVFFYSATSGKIFFGTERKFLLNTIDTQQTTIDRYVGMHENQTIPTLNRAITLFETVTTALGAISDTIDRQTRSNEDVARELDELTRRLENLERGLNR